MTGFEEAYRIREWHALRLAIGTPRYQSRKVFDEILLHRLRERAMTNEMQLRFIPPGCPIGNRFIECFNG